MSEEKETCHAEPQFVENTGSSASAPSKKKKFSRLWLLLLGVIAVIFIYTVMSFIQCFIRFRSPENVMLGVQKVPKVEPASSIEQKTRASNFP